jgi:ferric-dicitrate binding protein FerR (iron transport regulator)
MKQNYTDKTPWTLIGKELSGNISEVELKELQGWKSENSENLKIYDECKLIFDKAQSEGNFQPNTDAAWLKLSTRIATSNKRKTPALKLWHYAAAATIAILLLVSFWVYPRISTYFSSEDRTKWLSVINSGDDPKTIQMPDGSTIILNNATELKYPEKFDKRSVEIKGEAFFKVVYNPKKPFKVFADNAEIEVLGTSFNVRQKSNEVFVMVENGKVNFNAEGLTPMLLLSGKGLVYNKLNKKISPKNNPNASAWNTKSFRFQNTSVEEIISSLQDVYALKIEVSSEALLKCAFNGVFDNIAPENILHALSFSMGAKLSFENGVYTLTGSGCNN